MAFKFMDNFYQYGEVGSSLADANSNFNTGWIVHGGVVPVVINTGFTANAKSLLLDRTVGGTARVERRFTTESDTHIVGFAFRATQRAPNTFVIQSNDERIVELKWPKEFEINGVLGNATILLNRLWFVEIKLTKSTKAIELRVNGRDYGLTTTSAFDIGDTIQCFWGYEDAGPAASMSISDVYYIDGTTTATDTQVDYLGPQSVKARPITAEGSSNWAVEPEDGDRVTIMNNIPANASEYTESDQVGTKDLYLSSELVGEDDVINAVAVTSLLTKTDIDDQYVAMVVQDGTDVHTGEDQAVLPQPTYMQQVFTKNAALGTWDKATVEATEFGVEIRPRP